MPIKGFQTISGIEKIDYTALVNTPESLPASDVFPWAKQIKKPEYTPDEIIKLYSLNLKNTLSLGHVNTEALPVSTTFTDIDSAEAAGVIDNDDTRKKYMQLFALRSAPDGTIFYDESIKKIVFKEDGNWYSLTGTEVVYNFDSTT